MGKETYDCIIVGCGPAGLGAALQNISPGEVLSRWTDHDYRPDRELSGL